MIIHSILNLLISNAVTSRRDKSILYSRNALLILIFCLLTTLNEISMYYLEEGIGIYGGLFHVNIITQSFNLFIFTICVIILQLTAFHSRKVWHNYLNGLNNLFYKLSYNNTNITNKMGEQFKIIEYSLILLFIITGGVFLISCSDIISIFLSIELQSYGLYLLAALYRNSELSTSAGLTYFLLGGLSSCFILLGTSLLYVNYGTTNLEGYYILNNVSNFNLSFHSDLVYKPFYLSMSLMILLVGFMFKVSAAPFHFWSPDVYDAIPTIVTTFVAIVAKISILVFLLEFLFHVSDMGIIQNLNWKHALLISCLLSLIVGSILGLTQTRIKRLFAYSTISHLGFILLAINIGSLESLQAFTFYLIQYSITNLNAFFILLAIGYSLYIYVLENKTNKDTTELQDKTNKNTKELQDKTNKDINELQDKDNSPIQLSSELQGYSTLNPILSVCLAITLFSLVGIPPLMGFFAKQMVLTAAIDTGYMFLTLVAILTSVISAYYYLNIIKQVFMDKAIYVINEKMQDINYMFNLTLLQTKTFNFNLNNISLSNYYTISIASLTLIILLFMYNPINLLNIVLLLGITFMNC